MKLYKFNNIKFYLGENAEDNWDLFERSKEINENYIWFHLNSFASPYVIMYATIDEIKSLSDSYLNYGGILCLENSKYSYLRDTKIIYSELKKLKKGDKVGEIIITGKKKLIRLDMKKID
tara:strand:+ start:342 stop:701 length:360 start_codon:yes stop_codon:yes gene_type:complete